MYAWQGPKKTYTKWILVPLWIAHIAFLVVIIGAIGYLMLELSGRYDHDAPYISELSAFIALLTVALIMTPLEAVLQSYRILEPWLYLTFQIYKAIVGTVLLAVGIYFWSQASDDEISLGQVLLIVFLVLVGLMALSFYGSLVYAAVVMHKHRKSSNYHSVEFERGDDESL